MKITLEEDRNGVGAAGFVAAPGARGIREGKEEARREPRPTWRQGALGVVVAVLLTGCVGYVDGGYSSAVVVPGPDVYVFGGGYERGHVARAYSNRGFHSRAVAHPGGGRRH